MTVVYKICPLPLWRRAEAEGVFRGSADDLSDGFVHFSERDQLQGTAERHFAGEDNLVLVAVDAKSLGPALRWEASRSGTLYPHLYAPLDLGAVLWTRPIVRGADGRHVMPVDAIMNANRCTASRAGRT